MQEVVPSNGVPPSRGMIDLAIIDLDKWWHPLKLRLKLRSKVHHLIENQYNVYGEHRMPNDTNYVIVIVQTTMGKITLEDKLQDFPSDELVTKLALITG